MEGVFIDLNTRRDILELRPANTFWSAFGPVITVVTLEIFVILGFHLYIRYNILGKKKEVKSE